MAKVKVEPKAINPKLQAMMDEGIPLEYVICKETVRSSGIPERAFYSPSVKGKLPPTHIKTRLADLWLTQAGIVIQCDGFLTMTSLANAFDYKPL